MKSFSQKPLVLAISAIYTSLMLYPAYASDTEIYTNNESTELSPTLMMMFDTSGSMDFCMNNDSTAPNCCTDSKGKAALCSATSTLDTRSRMDVLRSTMRKVLLGDTATNVSPIPGYIKMGLSQYHPLDGNKGGYILTPARPLDSFVKLNDTGAVLARGASLNSDMTQDTKTPAVVGNILSGDITIGADGAGNRAAGLNFENVMIPKGAIITNAYILVTAKTTQSGLSNWYIDAEMSGDAENYVTTPLLATTRNYSAPVTWQPTAWVAGQQTQIPVTEAVQAVVSQTSWCGGNKLAIRIRDVGNTSAVPTTRVAYSFDSAGVNTNLRPQLVVSYTIDPESKNSCIKSAPIVQSIAISNGLDDVEWSESSTSSVTSGDGTLNTNNVNSSAKRNMTALRFNKILAPKGMVLSKATLRLRASDSDITGTTGSMEPITVQGFNVPNLAAFCTTSCLKANVIEAYSRTSSVTWTLPSNTITKYDKYELDVKTIVQEIINQSTWVPENSLGFILYKANTSNTNSRGFYSYNKKASVAPVLDLEWTDPQVTDLSKLRTVREELVDEVNRLYPLTNTPLGQAYAETSRYLMSMRPYNTVANIDFNSRTVNTATPPSYVSPIAADDNCSANYIFLLTDGDPTNDTKIKENTTQILNWPATVGQNSTTTPSPLACSSHWDCIKKLATFNVQAQANNTAKTPKKSIRTSTVILGPLGGTAETEMDAVAKNGQGKYFKAGDEAALVQSMLDTVKDLEEVTGTFAAAGVAVNQLNRLNHLDQLYYAVFAPKTNSYRWDGNLKRYKLSADGATILDANDTNAVGTDGLFKAESKSYWSEGVTADGANASAGGAASVLPKPDPDPVDASDTDYRRMFTHLGALTDKNVSLTAIKLGDPNFDPKAKQTMQISDDGVYQNILNWYKGYDVSDLYSGVKSTNTLRKKIGAALHSQPLLVNYGYTGNLAAANNPDNQINYVFFSTLEGTLHAVNAKTGKEAFSFIPGEKLATLKDQIDNPPSAEPSYGMDSTWVSFRTDQSGDGKIGAGDSVYLYGGMRMGGSNYYALNVTDITSPKLLFAIEGGKGDFARLGQTWSQPVIATVNIEKKKRVVLIFGGGYDPKHESSVLALPFGAIDKGNAVYMVDAKTGELLWYASGSTPATSTSPHLKVDDMKFSVPTSPTVIDKNGDSIADTIYFGDLGGQVFRVDLDPLGVGKTLAKRVRLLASLGQTATATAQNQRRFYEPAEVAFYKDTNGYFATVAIGSGYRSHPLNVVTNEQFYTLFDRDILRSNLLSMSDTALQSTITNASSSTDLAELDMSLASVKQNGVDVSGKKGWYVKLPASGEKSLAKPLIFNDKLVFTTYVPTLQGASNCSPVTGQTNQYVFCLPYGKLCSTTSSGYVKQNIMSGIGGDPQVLITKDGNTYKPILLTGTKSDKDVFNDTTVGSGYLQSAKKWREKVKKQKN